MIDAMRISQPRWRKILQNPVWYVAVVVVLAVTTSYVAFLWWFAGLVALVWGVWLFRQLFGELDQLNADVDGRVNLTAYLDQTLAYKTQIDQIIKATANQRDRFQLKQLALQLDTCTKAVIEMVQHLADLRQDNLVCHDLAAVPEAITRLEGQLSDETNGVIATQLQRVLAMRKNQLALLEHLQSTLIQTELQLEHTVSVLGSIYSQILIGQSTHRMADYSRFSTDIDEEMHRLADQLEALREIKKVI